MRSPPSSPDSHLSARRHHHARRQYVHHRRADEDWRAGGDGDGHRRFTHGGLPTYQKVNQWDVSLGGRIIRDRLWFHGTFRYADLINGISRTDEDLARLRAFRSDFEPFHNFSTSKQPFVKLTTQIGTHELSGFWQNDRHSFSSDRERNTHPISPRGTGGSLYQAKLNSVWGNHLQTSFQASYNNKGGADVDTYEDFAGFGPSIEVHESIRISSGLPMGTGRLVTMNNTETISIAPSSMLVFRGDLTVTLNATSSMPERKTGRGACVITDTGTTPSTIAIANVIRRTRRTIRRRRAAHHTVHPDMQLRDRRDASWSDRMARRPSDQNAKRAPICA